MNPKHLTPNVRNKVVEAVKAQRQMMRDKNSKGIQKAFDSDEEIINFFTPFYEKVKNDVENKLDNFLELCDLEFRYGFIRGYLGGANINQSGDTIIKIG